MDINKCDVNVLSDDPVSHASPPAKRKFAARTAMHLGDSTFAAS